MAQLGELKHIRPLIIGLLTLGLNKLVSSLEEDIFANLEIHVDFCLFFLEGDTFWRITLASVVNRWFRFRF